MNEATFNQKLSSIMKDNMYDRFVSNRKTGRLDTRHLAKISYSDHIFKKKEERSNKNYAVSLMVDCSGSMQVSNKYKYASICAATLANSFRQIPTINFEIYGFNSWGVEIKGFNKPMPSLRYIRDKVISLIGINTGTIPEEEYLRDTYGFIYKDTIYPNYQNVIPKDQVKKMIDNCDCMKIPGAGENYDGLMINEMRHRMNKMIGKHVCIFLSDGQPTPDGFKVWDRPGKTNYDFDLGKEVKLAIEDGITLISIGVLDDSVLNVYPAQNVNVIYNLEELYPVIIDKFAKLIKRG